MRIHNFNTKEKVLIIAEVGNNHEGDYKLAEKLIVLAAESGANAVKFQTIIPEKLVSIKQTERINQLKSFQFSYEQFNSLADFAKKEGIIFLSTPFDIESAIFLDSIVPAFKIASGDNNFFPLIESISKTGKPIIMSTGLMNIEEIKNSVNFIKKIWDNNNIIQKVALLHCVSLYPTKPEFANLLGIKAIEPIADIVGYSDHTLGIDAAVLSVALGARIIEKHFTIDNNYSNFRDHKLSADPANFKMMVNKIRIAEKMLGDGEKIICEDEINIKNDLRRSIVARYDLEKGHKIKYADLNWVRPYKGFSPGEESNIIGRTTNTKIYVGSRITEDYLI